MAHTEGPWKFVPSHIAEGPAEVRAPEGWLICCTSSDEDAELIASTPDLLEVLLWVRKNYAGGSTAEINSRIDQVVSKAIRSRTGSGQAVA